MPIKNLSDIDRLPRCGKLRLGTKVDMGGGKTRPEKVDYLIFDPVDKAMIPYITELYGEKPKAVDVMFASNDQDDVFDQNMERWAFGSRICRGDGENGTENIFVKKLVNGKEMLERTGEKQVSCVNCPHAKERIENGRTYRRRCKPLARLMVLLPKLPGMGVWELDTSSKNSIINVNAGIKLVKMMYGKLAGVPLRLVLSPKTVQVEGRAKVVYVISISMEGTLEEALRRKPLQGEVPKGALPEPAAVDTEEFFLAEETGDEDPNLAELEKGTEEFLEKNEIIEPQKKVEPPEPPEPPQDNDNIPCLAAQRDLIENLRRKYKFTVDDMKNEANRRFKKTRSTDLTVKEANELIQFLERMGKHN